MFMDTAKRILKCSFMETIYKAKLRILYRYVVQYTGSAQILVGAGHPEIE